MQPTKPQHRQAKKRTRSRRLREYGWLLGRVVDPFGHHWEIGKPLGSGVGE